MPAVRRRLRDLYAGLRDHFGYLHPWWPGTPLEITLSRCDRLIAACRRHSVKLCTIFPSRFSAANRVLKEAIDEGRFGKLTLGDSYVKWWRTQSPSNRSPAFNSHRNWER